MKLLRRILWWAACFVLAAWLMGLAGNSGYAGGLKAGTAAGMRIGYDAGYADGQHFPLHVPVALIYVSHCNLPVGFIVVMADGKEYDATYQTAQSSQEWAIVISKLASKMVHLDDAHGCA